MKNWIHINEKSVSHYLLPIQLQALRQHSDPLNEIIDDTIARVRAEIQSNPNNPLSSDPSLIPIELKIATCHLIIEALQSRIPNLKLTEDQIRNANNARTLLKRVALAEVSINTFNRVADLMKKIDVASMRQRQASLKTLLGL